MQDQNHGRLMATLMHALWCRFKRLLFYFMAPLSHPERSYYGRFVAPNDMLETPSNTIKVRFYNWSSYYAMAVIELGEAVAQRMAR